MFINYEKDTSRVLLLYIFYFRCDMNWTSANCSEPVLPLPTYLYDKFDDTINDTLWSKVVGAEVTQACDVLGGGNALHFTEVRLN